MAVAHRMVNPRKILVRDVNDSLLCSLCGGYLIDATAVVDCSHTFCRACIVRHFESSRLCPNCGCLVHKNKPLSKLRSDPILQSIVYKVVPSLYSKELQRRADFYHSTGFRANSSCSDDSILGDRSLDNEEWVLSNIGDPTLFFSPDDSISLSVEYYQQDETEEQSNENTPKKENDVTDSAVQTNDVFQNYTKTDSVSNSVINSLVGSRSVGSGNRSSLDSGISSVTSTVSTSGSVSESVSCSVKFESFGSETMSYRGSSSSDLRSLGHKRFLQCPAAVKMCHLMKFLRMKFGLSDEHRVDIIYAGEVLPQYLSLMDVAYTFRWKQECPMRLFYAIYVPILRPTLPAPEPPSSALSAPAQPKTPIPTPPTPPLPPPPSASPKTPELPVPKVDLKLKTEPETEEVILNVKKSKELKIKEPVKSAEYDEKKEDNNNVKTHQKSVKFCDNPVQNPDVKIQKSVKFADSTPKSVEPYNSLTKSSMYDYKIKSNIEKTEETENCVYDYAEPDKDEIKEFAERRDREWALQKHTDAEIHVSKKRKKNKHSKNESLHKKRKLHAEITSNEVSSKSDDSLKLKVKLSLANGHKHKHRSNSSSSSSSVTNFEPVKTQELSPKERLLQMRQVRHKNISAPVYDDKTKNSINVLDTLKIVLNPEKQAEKRDVREAEKIEEPKAGERTPDILAAGKTLRSDFSFKTSISKDICNKYVRINLEKCTDTKPNPQRKSPVNNIIVKNIERNETSLDNKYLDGKTEIIPIENKPIEAKLIEAKPEENKNINNITITEAKKVETKIPDVKPIENKITKPVEHKLEETKSLDNKINIDFKNSDSPTLVTKNFTVSKVESGTKRKTEEQHHVPEKRPSLEITVINMVSRPQTSVIPTVSMPLAKPAVSISDVQPPKKIRPPPLTIPLGRIQKMNLKNAIMSKPPEKCDIFGALDLSAKPNKPEIKLSDIRASSASPNMKMPDQIQNIIRPKTPIKSLLDIKTDIANKSIDKLHFSDKIPNISNLQMLSESAVQIRERMVTKNSTIPNLIKKTPICSPHNSSLKTPDYLQKSPNFPPKTPNLIPKNPTTIPKPNFPPRDPNFLPKNLQKLPKLNEINKGQFCRMNSSQQIRNSRPAGQNQSIRNIPNPSLLVRQQNQNRINSMASNSNSNNFEQNQDLFSAKTNNMKPKIETKDTEKKPSESKASEPPPLKPIESFKK